MARHVHVHIHRGPTSDEEGGRWVTIHGARIHIAEDGYVDKGPKHLVEEMAHTEHSVHAVHHEHEKDRHHGEAERKGEDHPDHQRHRMAAAEHSEAARHFATAHSLHAKNPKGNKKDIDASHQRGQEFAEAAKRREEAMKNPEPHGEVTGNKMSEGWKNQLSGKLAAPDYPHGLPDGYETELKRVAKSQGGPNASSSIHNALAFVKNDKSAHADRMRHYLHGLAAAKGIAIKGS
jgi:hypothetical protein